MSCNYSRRLQRWGSFEHRAGDTIAFANGEEYRFVASVDVGDGEYIMFLNRGMDGRDPIDPLEVRWTDYQKLVATT